MVKARIFACLLVTPYCVFAEEADFSFTGVDAGLNLLQLRAAGTSAHNASNVVRMAAARKSRNPSDKERAMCPHEIDAAEAAKGGKRFGCASGLVAPETVTCSIWGEPHVTALFPNGFLPASDVLYKSGHFRLAAAADRSWEVQLFNCGVYANAMAARFGKTLVEIFVDKDQKFQYLVNGKFVDSLPAQIGEFFLDSTHRSIRKENFNRPHQPLPGTCMDDPAGQVNIDVAQEFSMKNLNVKIEAASDSVTTNDTDPYSLCNLAFTGSYKWADWPVQMITSEMSLFTIGDRMCEGCTQTLGAKWFSGGVEHHGNSADAAKLHCSQQQTRQAGHVIASSMCRDANIPINQAEDACKHLVANEEFFKDCQIDYCASGGQQEAAEEAEGEEAIENPQPICISGDECDPAADCCAALKDQATLTLDNVVTNEICAGGELRYGSALTQNGQTIDLVVKPVGDFGCTGKLDKSSFGSKNAQIGILSVNAGNSQAFEFSFMAQGTNSPVVPQSMMISILDLDQGKKGKQRESVEICGAEDTITTDDTEVELSVSGDCVKATSSTPGNGRDNPNVLEEMSQQQRARTVAYKVTGSSFTATLGVSNRGRNPRRFNFAGHPTVACVLK